MSQHRGGTPCGVTAIGMVSALGRDAITSCAAGRSGLSMPSELKVMDFQTQSLFGEETYHGPPAVVGHAVRGIAEGFAGPAKALMLGVGALREVIQKRGLSPQELRRTALVLNLSDWVLQDEAASKSGEAQPEGKPSQRWIVQTADLGQKLVKRAEVALPPELQIVVHGGHAGLALAVREALTMIERGRADRCLVGGIESRVEPAFLRAAAALKLLRTNDTPAGLMPGEGAAFFLLEPVDVRGAKGAQVVLDGVASGSEAAGSRSDALPNGASLAQTLLDLLREVPLTEQHGWMIGDLNGTERRAMEWGRAAVRVHAEHPLDQVPLWLPASSFGDTGAASAAMGVCMAVRAFERGYAPARRCLLWMCSEGPHRGALALRHRVN
ncbi:beta-ketoacyl synthase N-terminal-like domain-containing protein [Chondromyces apiculatus]|uniref:Beta-ketoacyl synthase-like N-terminal domain-containing protein n=1 Tax=Chondromyces apiculatus DSM 436 TaxID=1192034 RepID=A0A017TC62_9BACT|nr:beta-ketoacyl synthase N-terminal-like domain-containing protein [Chondromyces apiculatus]EYF06839.1 Hypothetical protein CAP_1536 [Chondromyces apiculatus DSM 436]